MKYLIVGFIVYVISIVDIATYASECKCVNSTKPLTLSTYFRAYQTSILSSISYLSWEYLHGNTGITPPSSIKFDLQTVLQDITPVNQSIHIVAESNNETNTNIVNNIVKKPLSLFITKYSNLITTKIKSLYSHPKPPISNSQSETFHMHWFFDEWTHGIWHDTDVLISSSDKTVSIVFRGTDSYADMITTMQTFEKATRRGYFKNCTNGSLHRGILSAYADVNSGTLIALNYTHSNGSSQDYYDSYIRNIYNKNCISSTSSLFTTNNQTNYNESYNTRNHSANNSNSCDVRNTPLSKVLVSTVLSALRANKRVVISGHSLGGALASFLSFDILLNHYDIISPSSTDSINMTSLILQNMQVYTFGEPEIADEIFYNDITSRFPHVNQFLKHNYYRFVGVSRYPYCVPDLITKLTYRFRFVIGAHVTNDGIENHNDEKESYEEDVLIDMYLPSDLAISNSNSLLMATSTPPLPVNEQDDYERPSTNLFSKFQFLAQMNRVKNKNNGNIHPSYSDSEIDVELDEVERDRIGYFGDPIYVCSGIANNSMTAHSMNNYIFGLLRSKVQISKEMENKVLISNGVFPLSNIYIQRIMSILSIPVTANNIVTQWMLNVINSFFTRYNINLWLTRRSGQPVKTLKNISQPVKSVRITNHLSNDIPLDVMQHLHIEGI